MSSTIDYVESHATDFVQKADARAAFLNAVKIIAKASHADPDVRLALAIAKNWMLQSPNANCLREYQQMHQKTLALNIVPNDAARSTLVATAYLRAKNALAHEGTEPLERQLASGKQFLSKIEHGLREAAPDFLGSLLLTSSSRIADDPGFAEQVADAAKELHGLRPSFTMQLRLGAYTGGTSDRVPLLARTGSDGREADKEDSKSSDSGSQKGSSGALNNLTSGDVTTSTTIDGDGRVVSTTDCSGEDWWKCVAAGAAVVIIVLASK